MDQTSHSSDLELLGEEDYEIRTDGIMTGTPLGCLFGSMFGFMTCGPAGVVGGALVGSLTGFSVGSVVDASEEEKAIHQAQQLPPRTPAQESRFAYAHYQTAVPSSPPTGGANLSHSLVQDHASGSQGAVPHAVAVAETGAGDAPPAYSEVAQIN
mmetsp:Transcript_12974/g.17092  ORF Transcript_12974/g.17092 Transcript_12974/m.17092 type:complete len:155 (-) Transcript_12974:333-797(-)|eukprot:CAMPEP_0117759886 /NCGR_PEP_ID=MMETSP0947-20121206/16272_1 /TAXON_ID=44440 /ORGANISM="Chattonella subsalsa, Strain CCMP2191" /LENGTH=154 /DNA_ID=CAMNT_0005580413 /DNA_START=23 /DNA_END=487 /DNA_ORIENTATION=-